MPAYPNIRLRSGASARAATLAATIACSTCATGALPTAGLCPALAQWQASGSGPVWHFDPADASARVADVGFARFESSLTSPPIAVPRDGLTVAIAQQFDLSWANTVAVLDLRTPGSDWSDFVSAGGRFLEGGYNADSFPANPIGVRRAWGGPATQLATRAVLPPWSHGKTVELRFRLGSSGTGDAYPGWSLRALRCD
jgi:hypothetical protein